MKGSKILLESLKREGVKAIFGYPGGAVLEIYNDLFDEKEITHYLVRHEQGAAHMAEGYAKASGKVGVCLATSGPGATNLTTGIADAHMDSVPIVAITGQVPTPNIGKDAFQEADITGITMPITKQNYLIKDVEDITHIVCEAFHIAKSGRPGPVLIDLPKDITAIETEFKYPKEVDIESYKPTYEGHPKQIKEAAKMIANAQKPVFVAGGGVISSNASEILAEFVKFTHIPITTTLMGIGSFPSDHELCLGMPGMHGTAYANYAIGEADLLIAIGMRFDDRITGKISEFAKKAKVIHIDIDPAEIGKCVAVNCPIVGDAKNVLQKLLAELKHTPKRNTPWHKQIIEWKNKHPLTYKKSDKVIKPQEVIEEISYLTKGDAIITTEVGQHQMWSAQFSTVKKPRHFITSGGLGTMGFGFPAAIGAQVAHPNKLVIDIAGDGSFCMNFNQLSTAVNYKLPVKVIIIHNHFLGMVRQWQEFFYHKRYSQTILKNPDFVKLAESFGALGLRVSDPKELRKTLEKAFAHNGPVVVDVHVEPKEDVYPMIPAGGTLDKMIMPD